MFCTRTIEPIMTPWFSEARIRDSLMRAPVMSPVIGSPMRAESVQAVVSTSTMLVATDPFPSLGQAHTSTRAVGV